MKLLTTVSGLTLGLILQVLLPQCAGQGSGMIPAGTGIPALVGISPIITFIHEDVETNHEVVDLHAYDPEGAVIDYSLNTSLIPFDIDPSTGRIYVSGTLDREMTAMYTLVATVTDSDGLSGDVEIRVTILDVNDNPPTVDNTLNITIAELTEVGTRVHTIVTSDPDIGDAGSVEFFIISNGDIVTDRSFSISQFSGDITLVQSLDHEAVGIHILTVRVADLGRPAQSIIVNLTINVRDQNDRAPVFTRSLYTARVPEGNTPGARVVRVLAVDADNLGAQINYEITSGNFGNVFNIESDGLIVTRGNLDRETRSRYILTVQATEADSNSDALEAITTVTVEIEDVNDNSPTFHSSLYTGFAREDAAVGTNIITTVSAFDNDLGDNAEFRYRLSPQNSGAVPFGIDSIRGAIYVSGMIDYELTTSYDFEVEVYEVSTTEMRSDTAMVHIFIIDVNDNPPMFELDTYTISVREEQLTGAFVATIEATDEDAGEAGILTYSLTGFGSSRFSVDDNGNITTNVILDREDTAQYQLTLIATDTTTNPLYATTMVIINVDDINDNCPEFDPTVDYDYLLLEEMIHLNFFTPTVEDRDAGTNGQYVFNISDNINFNVSRRTGALSLINALDHEIISHRSLPVVMMACDMGTYPATMCCNQTINVTLRDRNDNMPQFAENPFTTSVFENITEGDVVIIASAVDRDQGTNAVLRYTFESNDDAGPFLINHTTGEITTVSSLDWETQSSYSIQVRAEDRGVPPQMDIATVNIIVLDVNEFVPSFNSTVIRVSVRESIPIGDTLMTLSAYDPDGSSDGEVTYEYEGNTTNLFNIDRDTGVITVATSLDREISDNIVFYVRVSDQGSPMLSNVVTINVTLIDDNDNCPQFNMASYSLEISESIPTGGSVLQLNVIDPDAGLNGEVVYTFGQDPPPQLYINSQTGLITVDVNNPLDYETNATLRFTVNATDMGSDPCTTQSQAFVITLTDANDNNCVFTRPLYEETLDETEMFENDTVVLTFTANDADQPGTNNSRVLYYIDRRDDNQLYELDSTTGELYVPAGGSLDRDDANINQAPNCRAIYRYRIEGRDQGDTPLSCYADVILYVRDINDNAPVFPTLMEPARVSESAFVGSLVYVAEAADADCGTNGQVIYTIIDGNEMNSFRVDSNTGGLYVNNTLDKETIPEYNLTIFARNVGALSYNTTTIIPITIVDHNDNNPTCPISAVQLFINESHPVGAEVTTVECPDPDSDEVTFEFASGNVGGAFAINSTTGIITVAESLDRETINLYRLTVYAEDNGAPPRTGIAEVAISLLDVDDSCPSFTQQVFIGTILENSDPNTPVIIQPLISAIDPDEGVNAEIIYGFSDGPYDQFAIANDTGLVTVIVADVDHDDHSTINLTLTATDDPDCNGTATLVVQVIDVNDNDPVFTNLPSSISVCEDTPVGEGIVNITASDRDSGFNGIVTYHLINSDEDFAINRLTGEFLINRPLDRERKALYNITVVATDSGLQPRSTSATMLVTLLDVNDNQPRFDPANIETCIPENADTSFVVTQLAVIDGDAGLNGKITYEIVGSVPFAIGLEDGIITPTTALDRETVDVWTVTVIARDQGGDNAVDTSPSAVCTTLNTSQAMIDYRICLNDVNDNCPQFGQVTYNVDVLEETGANAIVFHLIATDGDIGTNGVFQYSFNTSNPATGLNLFRIDETTGVIRTLVNLDLETLQSSYTFQVDAVDMGSPPCTSVAIVRIRIRDINDNNPICNQAFYQFNVTENMTSPVLVGDVDAYEIDDTLGEGVSLLDYSIADHPSQERMFNINRTTGLITTSRILDREEFSSHVLTVIVSDQHNTSRIGYCTVFVTVIDQNDECPVFLNGSGAQLFVMENSVSKVFVGRLVATDADVGINAMITYMIREGDPSDQFDIDPMNGTLVTSGTEIDREVTANFSLTICAIDAGPSLVCAGSCINITVVVEDACDHTPTFDDLPREVNISESTVVGAPVTTVTATDLDLGTNGVITYSITDGNIGNAFTIGEFSGVVTVANSLDYDATTSTRVYILHITATDMCSDTRRNQTSTLTIRLANENDHSPECPIIPLLNATEGQNLTTFYSYTAVDADVMPFNRMTYTITSVPTGNVFAINSDTGLVSVVRGNLLDRETMSLYCETIVVFDSSLSSLSCSVQLCVNVADANDNCPMFSTPTINTTVAESLQIGTLVDTITAVDNDIGINAQFNYHIVGGSGQGLFSISSEGEIFTSVILDREVMSSYELNVETRDMGTPQMTCSATVIVTIIDANDNSPSVVNCLDVQFANESSIFGSDLFRMIAMDNDIGENGRVSFHFGNNSNDFGPFQINRETGIVTAVGPLDRETQDSYSVILYAVDHGIPSPRETACTLTINITDTNDNVPSFEMNPTVTIGETEPVGPVVGSLSSVSFDLDVAPNNNIYFYYIANLSSNCFGTFCIDSSTGDISLLERLDFETTQSHFLIIAVSNHDTFTPLNIADYKVGNVTIAVRDVNDFVPQFTNTIFTAGVTDTSDLGDIIYQIRATDPEDGDFGLVWYRSVASNQPFSVERDTGNVRANQTFQGKAGMRYEYEIEAYDNRGNNPSLIARRTLTIWVVRDSQKIIIVMDVGVDLVTAKQENITRILSMVTGYSIEIQKIRPSETNREQNVDASMTDVIIYAIDPATNLIVNRDRIISLIDGNFDRILNLLEECKVDTVKPFPVERNVTESTFEDSIWLIIIGILVILIILLCCCLLCCCFIFRRRTKVTKHNKTVDSYNDSMRLFALTEQTKNTNPLWLAPYKEWEAETKEVDFDAESREERNLLYESKEIMMEMLPPPQSAEPSTYSLTLAEPPPDATVIGSSKMVTAAEMGTGYTATMTKSYTTSSKTTEHVITYDRDSMDSDTVNALLEQSLNQPGNRESNTMELLAAVASDEEIPEDDRDDTALI